MNTVFPRILTLLRKERGISQKKAAQDLEISQALLSHYEKGIRECGLDFLVRAADYYHVSCDYLLGRTADKSGAVIAVDEIRETDPHIKDNQIRGSMLAVLNKKLVVNSVNIIFDLLQRVNHKGLTAEVSAYLFLAVYGVFRQLCLSNNKSTAAMFSMPAYIFQASLMGELGKSSARIAEIVCGREVNGEDGVAPGSFPALMPDTLSQEYPLFATSLFNLLRNAEGRLQ